MKARKWIGLFLSSLLIIGLAGCGGAAKESAVGEAKAPAGQAAQAQAATERVYKHAMGEVKLTNFKNIAVLSAGYMDHLLALGVKPGAGPTDKAMNFTPYLADKLQGVKPLGDMGTPNLEAILQAQPDLIIGQYPVQEKIYEGLSKIASTIMLDKPFEDWRKTFLEIGKIVGKEEEAKKKLDEFSKKTAGAKEQLSKAAGGQTVLFLRLVGKEVRLYGGASPTGKILYEDLGLKMPPVVPKDAHAESIAIEKLPEVNPDHIFLLDQTGDGMKAFKDNPLWKNLKAVQQGKIYPVDVTVWIQGQGLIAYEKLVDQVVQSVAK